MKKVTSKTITVEQIEEVKEYVGCSENLSNYAYAFYYNQMLNDLDLCDADRYANLNTVLGYDVGIRKFRSLDRWLWEHDFDLMELTGSDEDKEMLQKAVKGTRAKDLDWSKWKCLCEATYIYSYFESGTEYH